MQLQSDRVTAWKLLHWIGARKNENQKYNNKKMLTHRTREWQSEQIWFSKYLSILLTHKMSNSVSEWVRKWGSHTLTVNGSHTDGDSHLVKFFGRRFTKKTPFYEGGRKAGKYLIFLFLNFTSCNIYKYFKLSYYIIFLINVNYWERRDRNWCFSTSEWWVKQDIMQLFLVSRCLYLICQW